MAGSPQVEVDGLKQFLRGIKKFGPEVEKELKVAARDVAKFVVAKAQQAASTAQERQVAAGLQAKNDRIPSIKVSTAKQFVSKSRSSRRRTEAAKAKVIDVFFGAEFGGGKHGKGNPTNRVTRGGKHVRNGGGYTTQFRPHQGTTGYFFYPTVRREGRTINKLYGQAVDRALRKV